MDDPRIEWLRDQVYLALDIQEKDVFEDLLDRDDGVWERALGKFLNDTPDENESSILFYKIIKEEEEEVEVECEPEIPDIQQEEEVAEGEGEKHEQDGEAAEPQEQLLISTPGGTGDGDEEGTPKKGKKKKKGGKDTPSDDKRDDVSEALTGRDDDTESKMEGGGGGGDHDGEGESHAEESQEEKQPKTKIVLQKVMRTYLYMCYQHLPEEFIEQECVYFLRNTPGMVALPNSMEEALQMLPGFFEFGLLNGHSLVMLEHIITQVYMPLLSFNQHKHQEPMKTEIRPVSQIETQASQISEEHHEIKEEEKVNIAESRAKAMLRDEFLINMQKFSSSINRTIQQIEGEVRLKVPELELSDNIEEIVNNSELMDKIRETCSEWTKLVHGALEAQVKKIPQGNGPLAEIDFWRERNAALSALVEQLKIPTVSKMLEAYSHLENDFEDVKVELNKFYVEAKDNVRFLSTLERHFKNITHGATFQVVIETIPSMMNALRMVWIISRHYNKDERMVPLMSRIAWELAERVDKVINIRTIFKNGTEDKKNTEEVKRKTKEAEKTLQAWKQSYFTVRAKIESSGRDPRWEFDRKKLFERTDYMSKICLDLYNVAQVLEEFYNIFGPELKAVTGDPKRIEEVLVRVNALVKPLEEVAFDPFVIKHQSQWQNVMDRFDHEVEAIEGEAKMFIDESFQSLRSAEGAFDMLLNFKHIRSREAINAQMMQKFRDILVQYQKEVDLMDKLFQENKDNPPLHKNHSPVAGAIFWERSLFHRVKHVIIRFQSLEDMMTSEMGKQTRAKYLSVGKQMKAYEDMKYEQWREHVEQVLPSLLKRNLLVKPTQAQQLQLQAQEEEKEDIAKTVPTVQVNNVTDKNISPEAPATPKGPPEGINSGKSWSSGLCSGVVTHPLLYVSHFAVWFMLVSQETCQNKIRYLANFSV